MDGIKCLSFVPCGLILFEIWIQIGVLADPNHDVIYTSVVYLVLCCICLSGQDHTLKEDLVLVWWQVQYPNDHLIIRYSIIWIFIIGLDLYGFSDDI